MEENNLLSETQIGFEKNCRTSDHIFVLKCIIEQAKANKKPIYACFVDLKKAFDTVCRAGLFYKMLVVHKISPKFIRVLHNMYGKLQGIVKVNGQISKPFNINVGLRQGCNISPHLFNIYVNELPELLRQARCDPVLLHNKKVNILMYADDMLLVSYSPKGLQYALCILEAFCSKWQLVVNTKKTKIMIFNKRKYDIFQFLYKGHPLDIAKSYIYLGLTITPSGSFTQAIKDLTTKAKNALFALNSSLRKVQSNPKLALKLFDTLIKPIALYGCEVWGAFGSRVGDVNTLLNVMLDADGKPFEALNIKACKQALHVNKKRQ
jgi:hypothetical protein